MLGFRSFSDFNQLLVANLAWRIIKELNSFMARVLKAKYFCNSSMFEVPLGSNVSFVWRGIQWGLELMHLGTFWRTRDASYIRISQDP